MGLFSWLKSIFTDVSLPAHDYVQPPLVFPQLDVQRMQRRLELTMKGETRGSTDLPRSEDSAFDAVENNIVTIVQGEGQKASEKFAEHMQAYAARQATLDIANRIARVATASDETSAQFFTIVRQGRDALFRVKEELTETEEEYQRFRVQNGLTQRGPKYPRSRILYWSLIVMFVLVETPLNGSFLALGNTSGLVGGLAQALVIAVVNVSMGVIVGSTAFRHLANRRWVPRLLALAGTVAWIVVACAFNLAVAHYRAALAGDYPEQAGRIAIQRLRLAPFDIGDVAGWLLCVMGIAFNGAAAFDRWKMDDPYPGYGELARRREELGDEYISNKQEIENDLADIKDSALAAIDLLSSEIEGRKEEHRGIILSRANLNELFQGHLRYLEQCGNELLTAYRQANISKRSTPAPQHFHEQWRSPRIAYAGQMAESPSVEAEDMLQQLQRARTNIIEAFKKAMEEFHAVEVLGQGAAS